MNDEQFKDCICKTLKENQERFICGREGKRDNFFFGLRQMIPPIKPEIQIRSDQVLNDTFLIEELRLPLQKISNFNEKFLKNNKLPQRQKHMLITNNNYQQIAKYECTLKRKYQSDHDIYEFQDEEEDLKNETEAMDYVRKNEPVMGCYQVKTMQSQENTNSSVNVDNDSSEDEIRHIKHIIDKVKKQSIVKSMELLNEDDNANDVVSSMAVRGNSTILDIAEKHTETERVPTTDGQENKRDEDYNASTLISHNNSVEINTKELSTREERPTRNSRKRKTFSLSTTYSDNSYDHHRLVDGTLSSDDNSSSSSRGGRTSSLDLMIPPPKNFHGQNNPFRMVTPKKQQANSLLAENQNIVINGVERPKNLTTYNFNTKLEALKKTGIFTNLNATNLFGKAVGQQRTVRTVKRKLSAKDIKIGPNQEIKWRRNRRANTGNIGVN